MGEGSYKAQKGLIRVKAEMKRLHISEISISGDFFMYPEDFLWTLEKDLLGTPASKDAILTKIESFYKSTGILTPGVTPNDFTEAIIIALLSP